METLCDIQATLELLVWDRDTQMPTRAISGRKQQIATISRLHHRVLLQPELEASLAELRGAVSLAAPELTMVRIADRLRKRAQAIPEPLVGQLAAATSECVGAWTEARENDDVRRFAKALSVVVELKREEAAAIADKMDLAPYDVFLDEWEPNLRTAQIHELFQRFYIEVQPLLELHRNKAPRRHDEFETLESARRDVLERLADAVGFDHSAGVLGHSSFTSFQSLGGRDARLKVGPELRDGVLGVLAALHELGHALYDQGRPFRAARTFLQEPSSLAVDESQGALWENHVGRRRAFWSFIAPRIQGVPGVSAEQLHARVSRVEPTPLRKSADEVTYPLHVALRFELEVALIGGTIAASELPEAWDAYSERYLGVRPANHREGLLQDVHWAVGAFGYFPLYAIGRFLAAQLAAAMEGEIGPLDDHIRRGHFEPMLAFLREHVYRDLDHLDGRSLMRQATGRELGVSELLDHLRRSYGGVSP